MHGRYRSGLSQYAREIASTQRRRQVEVTRRRLEVQQLRRAKRESKCWMVGAKRESI